MRDIESSNLHLPQLLNTCKTNTHPKHLWKEHDLFIPLLNPSFFVMIIYYNDPSEFNLPSTGTCCITSETPGTCTASNKPDTDTSNSTRMEIPEAHKSVTCLMRFHHQPVFCYHSVCLSPPLLCKQVQNIGTSINEPGTVWGRDTTFTMILKSFLCERDMIKILRGLNAHCEDTFWITNKNIQKATCKKCFTSPIFRH